MEPGKVPWHKIGEYLRLVSLSRTRREFMRTAIVEMQKIIPFDETAGVFDESDAKNLEGIGKTEAVTAAYNNYYRTMRPGPLTSIMDWRKYDDLEFTIDFMFPNGMYKTLRYRTPGHQIYMRISRSRLSPNFSDSDIDTLGVLDDYLNNLYSSFDKKSDVSGPTATTQQLGDRFPSLSLREAEVCSLIARRLNTAEIAACLFINRRTVEKHVESVFQKLDVRSREQLRWRLGVLLPRESARAE